MEGDVFPVRFGARSRQRVLVALAIEAGDRVLLGKWSGTEIKIDGEDLLVMKEANILGVVDNAHLARNAV